MLHYTIRVHHPQRAAQHYTIGAENRTYARSLFLLERPEFSCLYGYHLDVSPIPQQEWPELPVAVGTWVTTTALPSRPGDAPVPVGASGRVVPQRQDTASPLVDVAFELPLIDALGHVWGRDDAGRQTRWLTAGYDAGALQPLPLLAESAPCAIGQAASVRHIDDRIASLLQLVPQLSEEELIKRVFAVVEVAIWTIGSPIRRAHHFLTFLLLLPALSQQWFAQRMAVEIALRRALHRLGRSRQEAFLREWGDFLSTHEVWGYVLDFYSEKDGSTLARDTRYQCWVEQRGLVSGHFSHVKLRGEDASPDEIRLRVERALDELAEDFGWLPGEWLLHAGALLVDYPTGEQTWSDIIREAVTSRLGHPPSDADVVLARGG